MYFPSHFHNSFIFSFHIQVYCLHNEVQKSLNYAEFLNEGIESAKIYLSFSAIMQIEATVWSQICSSYKQWN